MLKFVPVAFFACLSAASLPLAAQVPASASGPVVVVFPPHWSHAQRFAAALQAGGTPVSTGALSGLLIVEGDLAGLSGRLRDEGAWWVAAATVFSGCAAQAAAKG